MRHVQHTWKIATPNSTRSRSASTARTMISAASCGGKGDDTNVSVQKGYLRRDTACERRFIVQMQLKVVAFHEMELAVRYAPGRPSRGTGRRDRVTGSGHDQRRRGDLVRVPNRAVEWHLQKDAGQYLVLPRRSRRQQPCIAMPGVVAGQRGHIAVTTDDRAVVLATNDAAAKVTHRRKHHAQQEMDGYLLHAGQPADMRDLGNDGSDPMICSSSLDDVSARERRPPQHHAIGVNLWE